MPPEDNFLPYGRQTIDEDDIKAVEEALRGDWLTTGPLVSEFENVLARTVGAKYAVGCTNGTAALHLAAMAAGLGPADWSIVPTMTFLATANASRMAGADVWFADVDECTGLMTVDSLTAAMDAVGRRVKAVFPVHLNGTVADMESLGKLAQERGLVVIEDGCHALGSSYRTASGDTAQVGDCRFSHMTTFSFHPVKTLTTGEGGAVTTNDPVLAERLRRLRNHGMSRVPEHLVNRDLALDASGEVNPWYYEMAELGYNFRLTDIQCALGLSQLRKLEEFRLARIGHMQRYDTIIDGLSPHVQAVPRDNRCAPCLHLYPVLVDFQAAGVERAAVMRRLGKQGIGTQVHYIPVHRQPYYADLYGAFELSGADAYYRRVLSLPFFPAMAVDAPDRVAIALELALRR